MVSAQPDDERSPSAQPLTEDERRALSKANRALDHERDAIERGRRLRRAKNKKRNRR